MNQIQKYIFRSKRGGIITLTSTSVLASWSPNTIVNSGTTLDWTVSGGVTIATTTIDDPTFDFSGNSGTANVLIENVNDLTNFSLVSLNITSIDISESESLIILNLNINDLTTLDVSLNTSLTNLHCLNNNLSSLDVSTNINLTSLQCGGNSLTTLDVSLNTSLDFLQCENNSLTTLDVSLNTSLTNLACQGNSFSIAVTNQILADLVANNQNNGTLNYRNNETGQGVTDRATLITRGWTIFNSGT